MGIELHFKPDVNGSRGGEWERVEAREGDREREERKYGQPVHAVLASRRIEAGWGTGVPPFR